MPHPKYSILIPSRNGAQYLPFAVETVLAQKQADCEVIVSINHSTDNSLDLLSKINDPRLSVIVPPKLLSMSKNFEWLLHHSTGEWITFIGDDDGVMPYFFDQLEEILKRRPNIRAIASKRAYYYWEGYFEKGSKNIMHYESTPFEKIYFSKWCLLQALSGFKSYGHLPRLYTHGIIHRSIIQQILKKSNNLFFYEQNPDVYSAIAIAMTTQTFLHIEKPLFWTGASPKSVSLSFLKKQRNELSFRADEFLSLAEKDGIGIAKQIDPGLWKQGIPRIFVFSALRKIPFLSKKFQGKWVEYLVFGSLLEKRDLVSQSEFKKQIQKLGLKPFLLNTVQVILRVIKYCSKPIVRCNFLLVRRKFRKARVKLLEKDYQKIPNLKSASAAVSSFLATQKNRCH